jgi:hypothetical protein
MFFTLNLFKREKTLKEKNRVKGKIGKKMKTT